MSILNINAIKRQFNQLPLLSSFGAAAFCIITIGGILDEFLFGRLCLLLGVFVMYVGGIKQILQNNPFRFSVNLWSMTFMFLANFYALLFMDVFYHMFVLTCFIIFLLLLVSVYKLSKKIAI